MREVEDPSRDHRRAPVRSDVAQLGGDERHGNRRGDRELHAWMTHDLDLLGDRPVVHERERLIRSLIPRHTERQRRRAPDRRRHTDVAADVEGIPAVRGGLADGRPDRGRRGIEPAPILGESSGRPRRLGSPSAPVRVRIRLGIGPSSNEDRDRWLDVDARVAVEPPLPPVDHHRHVVDPRSGHRQPWAHVTPGTEEDLLRRSKMLERAERHVAVTVGMACDHERRRFDRRVVEEHRPVPPVVVFVLVLQPPQLPRIVRRDPPVPLLAPALPIHRRDGRESDQSHHVRGVVQEVDPAPRSAAVVDVVGVATVGRVDRDDRLQGRRAERGDLEGVEARVGGAVHPHVPVRPVLRGQPGDRLDVVLELARRVLVHRVALRRAGAADVGPADREAALVAETPVDPRRVREIVLAIGTSLEDDRPRRRRVGEMQGERDPHAVVHLEEPILVGHPRTVPAAGIRDMCVRTQPTEARPSGRASVQVLGCELYVPGI